MARRTIETIAMPDELVRAGIAQSDFQNYRAAIVERNRAVDFLNATTEVGETYENSADLRGGIQRCTDFEARAAATSTSQYLARYPSSSVAQALHRLQCPITNPTARAGFEYHRNRSGGAVQPPASGFRPAEGPPSRRAYSIHQVQRRKHRFEIARVLRVV